MSKHIDEAREAIARALLGIVYLETSKGRPEDVQQAVLRALGEAYEAVSGIEATPSGRPAP